MERGSADSARATGLGAPPPRPATLIEVCGWPEIAPLIEDLRIVVDHGRTDHGWRIEGTTIALGSGALACEVLAAYSLREAIEAQLVGVAGVSSDAVVRLLARHAAAAYATTVTAEEQAALQASLPRPEANLLRRWATSMPPSERLAAVADSLPDPPAAATDFAVATRAANLAQPTEVLFLTGGDDRHALDPATGTNKYGCSPKPRPWGIAFGSCTASSPTLHAYRAAEQLRRRLLAAALRDDLAAAIAEETTRVRQAVRDVLGVPAGVAVEVVLTPSGTDAEYLPLAVALAADPRPLTTVIVAPAEIGNGSNDTAAGRHFSSRTPNGLPAKRGEALEGIDLDRLAVESVDVRDADTGAMRSPGEVEAEIAVHLEAAHAAGRRLLVHLVDGAKTGIRLPRRSTVAAWRQQYGDDLWVVVDACQMRVDQQTAIGHLDTGAMVMVSGSKFFAGPQFSGAVLLPPRAVAVVRREHAWPPGLAAFLTAAEVPPTLPPLRAAVAPGSNLGLLLRWEGSLAEMRAFASVSTEVRDEILRGISDGVQAAIAERPWVELVPSPWTVFPTPLHWGLDELPTIFSFAVRAPGSVGDDSRLTADAARCLYHLMARNLAAALPESATSAERLAAAAEIQLGQPVHVGRRGGEWLAALRIAVGAPNVSRVVFDYRRGRSWRERLAREVQDAELALDKIGIVLRYAEAVGLKL